MSDNIYFYPVFCTLTSFKLTIVALAPNMRLTGSILFYTNRMKKGSILKCNINHKSEN